MKILIQLFVVCFTFSAYSQITPLQCDIPYTGTISTVGGANLHSFEVAAGEIFKITVITAQSSPENFQPKVRIVNRNGDPAVSCGNETLITPIDCGPFSPAESPYMAKVSDFVDDATGSYIIHLQRLTTGYICDEKWINPSFTFTDTIENATDSDLYTFNVPSQGVITFNVYEVNPEDDLSPYVRVLDRYGYEIPGCESYHLIMPFQCGPLYTRGNPHRLEIMDFFSDDTGPYTGTITFLSSGVQDLAAGQPVYYTLEQNFPNPFNQSTQISYALASDGFVTISVYNLSGQLITTLYSGHQITGFHKLTWDGRDISGHNVPSGAYICHMKTGDFEKTIEMMIAK